MTHQHQPNGAPERDEEHCDVVIVGSRLAGACAATHLAKAGRTVIALERAQFPSTEFSTHLLFPSGVHELHKMGALEGILAHDPVRSPWLGLHLGDEVHVHERWRASGPIDYAMCVPRLIQDAELVNAARAAGADVREKHRFIDVLWRGGRVVGVRYLGPDKIERTIRAKLVLGADGRRSAVAGAVGAFRPYRSSRNGRGMVFRYATDPMVDTVEGRTISQWRNGDSFGMVFPSAPKGKALLLFMGPAEEVAEARRDIEGYWGKKLAQHPGMARRVEGMTELTRPMNTDSTSAYFRASSGPGWALIGDAGHFKDPTIGQGQRDALWMGRSIAETATDLLEDPAALDAALRAWEQHRDRECLHAYHFANIDSDTSPASPVLIEILRRASRNDAADASDLFGRARSLPQVLNLPRMGTALATALWRGTGGQTPEAIARDALDELRIHLRIRRDLLAKRFRSTRSVEGSERANAEPPAYRPQPTRRRDEPTESVDSVDTATVDTSSADSASVDTATRRHANAADTATSGARTDEKAMSA